MDKVVTKEIKEGRSKGSEDKWLKRAIDLGTTTNWVVHKIAKKCTRAKFVATSTLATIREVGDKLKLSKSLWVDPCKYKSMNFRCTTWSQ